MQNWILSDPFDLALTANDHLFYIINDLWF
jgi:hypothetical protein